MKCAKCHNSLEGFQLRTEEIKRCPKCYSVFLDEDEMFIIKSTTPEEIAACSPVVTEKKEKEGEVNTEKINKAYRQRSKVICPRCRVNMLEYNFAYDSPIIINRCPKCSGVFLDPGELAMIKDFLDGKFSDQGKIAAAKLKLAIETKNRLYEKEKEKVKEKEAAHSGESMDSILSRYF